MPRLAIIGCGAVVELRMIDALRRIGWLPEVLVDISPQRLEAVARKMGRRGARVKKASKWESVADEFDAAIITLPNFLHASIGAALAKAGKHLFIEKPLAITGDECRAVISAAERSGVTLLVGLIRRYLHVARWTKALLEAGILGEIKRFEAHEGGLYGWDMGSGAPLQLKMSGGGVLIDTGAHTVDLLLWWFGDLELVEYRDDSQGGVEADCELECRFGANATGKLELSRTRMLSNSIRIEGTQGFIEVHLQENKVIAGSPNALAFKHDGVSAFDMPPQPHRFDAELKDFRTSASGGGLVGVMGREGTKSVELIERCYRARKPLSQAWVQVSPDTAQGA